MSEIVVDAEDVTTDDAGLMEPVFAEVIRVLRCFRPLHGHSVLSHILVIVEGLAFDGENDVPLDVQHSAGGLDDESLGVGALDNPSDGFGPLIPQSDVHILLPHEGSVEVDVLLRLRQYIAWKRRHFR